MADGYRPEFTAVLSLLAEAFAAAEKRGVPRPVIVGGAAVEFYTAGDIQSADVDLVSYKDDVLAQELESRGFRPSFRGSLRGFYHPDLTLVVDFVSGGLFEGRTDRRRLVLAEIDPDHGTYVTFPPVEDMIADRLSQYESIPGGHPGMLEQARLLHALAEKVDHAYLRKRVSEECVDGRLFELLETSGA